jgi:hypothetical protein
VATEEFDFLVGREVDQIWVSPDIRLVFELGDRPEPDMFVDFCEPTYVSPNSWSSLIDVRRNPGEAGNVFRVLKQRVTRASSDDGVLSIAFADGAELRERPDPQYESWGVVGDGRVFQCMPGGEVDSW